MSLRNLHTNSVGTIFIHITIPLGTTIQNETSINQTELNGTPNTFSNKLNHSKLSRK